MNEQEFQAAWQARFCYPNGTFKNFLNISDQEVLSQVEFSQAAQMMVTLFKFADQVPTNSVADFCRLHQALFGRLYPWAGQLRNQGPLPYELSKQGHGFLPLAEMGNAITWINRELSRLNQESRLASADYAGLFYDLNELHPFREGNGRATKTFLQIFARHHGQRLHWASDQVPMITALNHADLDAIAELLKIE